MFKQFSAKQEICLHVWLSDYELPNRSGDGNRRKIVKMSEIMKILVSFVERWIGSSSSNLKMPAIYVG